MNFSGKNWLLCAVLAGIFGLDACRSVKTPPNPPAAQLPALPKQRVLVFGKTAGYVHASIPTGMAAIRQLGAENNFSVDTTRDAGYFVQDSLKNYSAVVFMSTTMNVLNSEQQVAFERYIQAGGGYAGVHAAADTEYDWPWYNRLVGAYFLSHPKQQNAAIDVKDKTHKATAHLPDRWQRWDEWYSYKNIFPGIKVLATLDETSYEGGANGANHPIIWYHDYDGGRAFYTGLGHTDESYKDPMFLKHLLGGIQYAMGDGKGLDYTKSYSVKAPEENRFTKTVLANDLNEPMELIVSPDGRVFFTERSGKFYAYDPAGRKTKLVHDFPVKAVEKYLNGLIGVTLDPQFAQNNWIYFFYSSSRGEQYMQKISRFKISKDNVLDIASEQVIIEVPIDLEVSAHTGGSLAWDNKGNLFISTGDNTVPFESHGYAPMDERPGRHVYDAQRSAGNPNDLRGKILRIHPEADGSYTVPEGNLFAKGTQGTRPEIYVMGCRNPYRISVDTATSIVYWGEIGPDAGTDSPHGPRGYDEFNQAKKAGNFGWPYFVGNSVAYNDSDFATKAIGPLFDKNGPTNPSPNNTGLKTLPPPTPAMVYYPYNSTEAFPELGQGGRCAMGGPVYHYNASLTNPGRIPQYYDKALFVYDWMRNWVMAIRLDEQQNFKRIEPFMPATGDFRRPVDMEIGPDGVMYLLEYGSVYGIDNEDARLVRVDFNSGNRAPIAKIGVSDSVGVSPLTVTLNRKASRDYDEEDKVQYEWIVEGKILPADKPELKHTFTTNGQHLAVLNARDASGASSSDTVKIMLGNAMPVVKINTGDNGSFFFNKTTGLNYAVDITDKEDKTIDKKKVKVALKYIPKIADAKALVGHQEISENYNLGKTLMQSSDCKACHQIAAKSVGPAFMEVSKKYKDDKTAISKLANKVITGGGGVWGEHAMNAHPQLSRDEATEIVKYVLSLADQQADAVLPQQGTLVLQEHKGAIENGRYILTASYTDAGGEASPLTGKQILVLRPSKVQAEDADYLSRAQKNDRSVTFGGTGSYLLLKNIDLKDVTGLMYRYAATDQDGAIEVHTDSARGPVISTVNFTATGAMNKFVELTAPINNTDRRSDLYFVLVKKDSVNTRLATLDYIRFEGGREVQVQEPQAATKPAAVKPAAAKEATEKQTAVKTAAVKEVVAPKQKTAPKAPAQDGSALIAKSDCKTCHVPAQRLVGPSYKEIAKKYPKNAANISKLAAKIINGGAGNWGQTPMIPHPQISKADASAMAAYILSLK
jgi:cytochrome c